MSQQFDPDTESCIAAEVERRIAVRLEALEKERQQERLDHRRQVEELRRRETRYRFLFENMSEGFAGRGFL